MVQPPLRLLAASTRSSHRISRRTVEAGHQDHTWQQEERTQEGQVHQIWGESEAPWGAPGGGGRFNLVALNPLSVRTRDVDASASVLPQPNGSVISATLHWIPDDSGINPAMQARRR